MSERDWNTRPPLLCVLGPVFLVLWLGTLGYSLERMNRMTHACTAFQEWVWDHNKELDTVQEPLDEMGSFCIGLLDR